MSVRISHPDGKADFSMVYLGDLMIAFSYETPIAFAVGSLRDVVVRKNQFGAATERHMRHVEGPTGYTKQDRVHGEEFERRLAHALSPFRIAEQP